MGPSLSRTICFRNLEKETSKAQNDLQLRRLRIGVRTPIPRGVLLFFSFAFAFRILFGIVLR
jgi:hypothetical protein